MAEAITTGALDSVIVVDEFGTVVSFNPAAEQTFGYISEYAIDRLIPDLLAPPEQRTGCRSRDSQSYLRSLLHNQKPGAGTGIGLTV